MRFLNLAAATMLAICTPGYAGQLYEVPTTWRMQNYIPNGVFIYYTGAAGCTNGQLNFPTSVTVDDKDRFWSSVLTARATNKPVGIYFTGSGTSCMIDSFYVGP
jgi:hypothetical protein